MTRPDEPLRAKIYGRRHAAITALKSENLWEKFLKRLVRELSRAMPAKEARRALVKRLREDRDPRSRSKALGEALDALEDHDRRAFDRR